MIKVYGCPVCGKLTIGSMRTGMNCANCKQPMERLTLTFLEYTQMTEEEREDYGQRNVRRDVYKRQHRPRSSS